MPRSKACSNCFRLKKRCDQEKPCRRCMELSIVCELRDNVPQRPTGIVYTSKACSECNRSKTRCGQQRPCTRCVRIGLLCFDPPKRKIAEHLSTSVIPASINFGIIRFPQPNLEDVYEAMCATMTALSPFTVADFIVEEQSLRFISTIGCLRALIPPSKAADLTRRLVQHSNVVPLEYPVVFRRLVHMYEPPPAKMEVSPIFIKSPTGVPLLELSNLSDQQLMDYFMYSHVFASCKGFEFPQFTGVRVSIFKRDPTTRNVVLSHFLSPGAEAIFGVSSAQFVELSTKFGSSSDYKGKEFPQVLCHYHSKDLLSYCSGSLRAFLNPGQEVQGRVRVVHSNGTFIPCTCTQLVVLYPDGGVRSIISHLIPDLLI